MLILDTDAASVLAKGEIIEETLELFKNHKTVITPKIEDELEKPLDYGYTYPEKIFKNIETINTKKKEKERYRKMFQEKSVDKGELEAICVAENRNSLFFTMDSQAKEFAEEKDIQTITFNNLLKLIKQKEILDDKDIKETIKNIEERDNRKINTEEILEQKK